MTHSIAIGILVFLWMVPAPAYAQSADTAGPPPSFMRSITVFGIGDAYLLGNANRPPDGDNLLRNFDTRSGEMRLNYVEMAVERKTSDQQAFGFRADVGAGPTARMVGAPEPGPDPLKYLQQAYVSVRAPIGSGLTVDAGKFVTPAGAAERLEQREGQQLVEDGGRPGGDHADAARSRPWSGRRLARRVRSGARVSG